MQNGRVEEGKRSGFDLYKHGKDLRCCPAAIPLNLRKPIPMRISFFPSASGFRLCIIFFPLFFSAVGRAQNGFTAYTIPVANIRSCITSDLSGNVYIGTQAYGVQKFDGSSWSAYTSSNTPMLNNNIGALGTCGNDLWVGVKMSFSTSQLLKFDGTTWTDYSTAVSSAPVKSIIPGMAANIVWVGTYSGLYKFDGTNWTNYTMANSGLISDSVNCLALDPAGNLLVGTHSGLSVQNGSSWTNYTAAPINSIYSDAANGTWVWMGDLRKFSGGNFVRLNNLYSTSVNFTSSFNTLAKGPNGGVMTSFGSFLVEFMN